METNPLISVIIPVYNVGKFLFPCLDSLIAQTYRNLEILLIDDGSTDGSGERCDEYAAKDPRFKVIHKENGGVSSARNLGLDMAQGEYIAFIDSDDYVKPDYFEVLLRDIVEQNVDIVFCNFISVCEDGTRFPNFSPSIKRKERITTLETVLHQWAHGDGQNYFYVWGSLIKATMVERRRFSSRPIGEDTQFLFDILLTSLTIYRDTYEGYYYLQRSLGVTKRIGQQDLRWTTSQLPVYSHIYLNLPPLPEEDQDFFLQLYAQQAYNMAHTSSGLNDPMERRHYYDLLQEHLQRILPLKSRLPMRWRTRLTAYSKHPELYSALARFKVALRTVAGR